VIDSSPLISAARASLASPLRSECYKKNCLPRPRSTCPKLSTAKLSGETARTSKKSCTVTTWPCDSLLQNNGPSLEVIKVRPDATPVDETHANAVVHADNEDNVLIITPAKNAAVIERVKDIVMEHVPEEVRTAQFDEHCHPNGSLTLSFLYRPATMRPVM
jgi:hypothetical protein